MLCTHILSSRRAQKLKGEKKDKKKVGSHGKAAAQLALRGGEQQRDSAVLGRLFGREGAAPAPSQAGRAPITSFIKKPSKGGKGGKGKKR